MRLWESQPEKAKGRPTVKARSDGSQAVLEAGSFSWRADLPPSLGGTNAAPSPTAMLLAALAGCAVVFIRDTLAPQLGIQVENVEATAECQSDSRGLLEMAGILPDLQDIQLRIGIQSPDSQDKVQQLYRTWRERCPVYLALSKPLQVTTTLEIKRA